VWKTRGSKGVVYVFQVPGALRDGSMKYYERPVKLGLNDPVPFIAKDWMMSEEREGLIRHLPSGRSYLVRHDGAADIDGFFAVDDYGALLVDKGDKLPRRKELVQQGLEAITAFLSARGWNPVIPVPVRPKFCRTYGGNRVVIRHR
jgi:hypothetical protein